MDKNCSNCELYAQDEEVCCNYKSEHVADFTSPDDVCEEWEEKKNVNE